MVGWHHRLNGHGFEQAPGVGDGHGLRACCSPWGHKEWDTTEQLSISTNNSHLVKYDYRVFKPKCLSDFKQMKVEKNVITEPVVIIECFFGYFGSSVSVMFSTVSLRLFEALPRFIVGHRSS